MHFSAVLLAIVALQASHGAWNVQIGQDPITDRTTALAVTGTAQGYFKVQCESGDPESLMAFWQSTTFLGSANSDRERPAVYRLDSAAPVVTRWTYIDNRASIREGRNDLLNGLRSAKRAVFRGVTYRGGDVTIEVDVEGADQALHSVLSACGITLPAP